MKKALVAASIVIGFAFHLLGGDQSSQLASRKAAGAAREQWAWNTDIPVFVGCEGGIYQPNFRFAGKAPTQPCRETSDTLPTEATPTGTELDGATSEVGTIIVLGFSKAKVVVAADSRNTLYRLDGTFARYDDTACKLIEVTPTLLFAADGHTGIHGPNVPADVEYDAQKLARLAAKRVGNNIPKGQTRIYSIAQRWAWDVDSRMRHGFKMQLQTPGDLEGIFAGLEPNGETNVVIARLQYSPPRSGVIGPPVQLSIRSAQSSPAIFTLIEPFGMRDFAEDLVSRPQATDKAKSDHAAIEKESLGNPLLFSPSVPERLVSLTIQHHEALAGNSGPLYVHGPVDVAVIERRQTARWIRWKGCSGRHIAQPPKRNPQTASK